MNKTQADKESWSNKGKSSHLKQDKLNRVT